jgi:hypothetical protein
LVATALPKNRAALCETNNLEKRAMNPSLPYDPSAQQPIREFLFSFPDKGDVNVREFSRLCSLFRALYALGLDYADRRVEDIIENLNTIGLVAFNRFKLTNSAREVSELFFHGSWQF